MLLTALTSWSFLLLGCEQQEEHLPYYNDPGFSPLFGKEAAAAKPHTIGRFSLTSQENAVFSDKDIEGKIHVANFMFTSCGSICPVMTKNMKLVDEAFDGDKEVIILSYSVTPWIDTPEVLKKYKQSNGISNPNWHFLSGNKADLYHLARQSYFAEEELGFTKDSTEFLHTEHCLLVDKNKRIRGIYNGTLSLEMKQLIEDIRTLKAEN